ncbi:MAG TPA: hypothetical protein VFR23_16920 [Jiangellaceae bacterium]|nr:hypothetical protein [Jiangellaceae bacterium]
MNLTWLPRALGLATAAYGAAVLRRPSVFLRPTGLATGEPSAALAIAARAVAGRDLVSGLTMACAPAGSGLRTAIAIRVGCDVSDTVLFSVMLQGRPERAKSVAVAAGWGILCGLSALAARNR